MPSYTVFKGNKEGIPKQQASTLSDNLTGDNVLVRVTASGLCGTDLHHLTQDMALGHEGVGIVERVGPQAQILKVGDRVGWGYEVNSCGHCNECLNGTETFCPDREMYGSANLDQGSFASHAVWHEGFLHKIPENMSDVAAAPLQCGGATVFSTLLDTKPGETVGIMGVGGLGHLAIQFANKLGCRVVVFSSSDSKKKQALDLGAHEVVVTKNTKDLKLSAPVNRLIVTAAVQPDWDLLLPVLAPRATIYPMTVSPKPFQIPYMPIILQGLRVQGSLVATRVVHRQMLEFAALHGIEPIVEKYPMTEEGMKQAIDRLQNGKVEFRAVLTN